jgi:uncharacterized repeat protein (TIGR03803 family)
MLAARHSHPCPQQAADTLGVPTVPSKGKLEKITWATRQFFCLIPLLLAVATLQAQTFTESVLYDSGGSAGFIQAQDGNFYGGPGLKITLSGTVSPMCGRVNCSPDSSAPLIQGGDGNFYGTTEYGGVGGDLCLGFSGCGTVFKLTPSGTLTTLHAFCSQTSCFDGATPLAALIQGADGDFYGTTSGGGADGGGTVFKITPSGGLTTLYNFCSQASCADGQYPSDSLVQGMDGNFYGTAQQGGQNGGNEDSNGWGTVFEISPSGALLGLSQFLDGGNPFSGLVEGVDGNFYGTTVDGNGAEGSVFTYNPQGGIGEGGGVAYPEASLFAGSDGNFYGTDTEVIFQADGPAGLTYIYDFCSLADCADGETPVSPVVQGSDGNFYGNTEYGGTSNSGVVYKLSVSPSLPAPVQISLNHSTVTVGSPVTVTLKVLNAFSLTMQQCYAFQNGAPLGKVPGTYNSKTNLYTFSGSITPTKAGIYNYAVTCGGVESGFASLTVGDTTQTTLTASPNPVTPPAIVTLTATVTRTTGSGTPAGTVKFSVATTVLGTVKLNAIGVATLAASTKGIATGKYPVVATYSGDANDIASASDALNVTVK